METAELQAGLFTGWTDEAYFAHPAVSKSDLESHYFGKSTPKNPRTFVFGSAFDMATTQPWRVKAGDLVKGPDLDFRKPADREAWEAAEAEANAAGKILVRPAEWAALVGMIGSVKQNGKLNAVRMAAVQENTQVVGVAYLDDPGVWVKCKYDVVGNHLIDWKTTSCHCREEFHQAIWRFRYHWQAYLYSVIHRAITGEERPFTFLACSKRADHGYPCWDHRPDETQMQCAEADVTGLLRNWEQNHKGHPATLPF